jgi:hypothetical protein
MQKGRWKDLPKIKVSICTTATFHSEHAKIKKQCHNAFSSEIIVLYCDRLGIIRIRRRVEDYVCQLLLDIASSFINFLNSCCVLWLHCMNLGVSFKQITSYLTKASVILFSMYVRALTSLVFSTSSHRNGTWFGSLHVLKQTQIIIQTNKLT